MQQAEQNYIYILFAVLYMIYGIVKAVRKKQPTIAPAKKPTEAEHESVPAVPKNRYHKTVEKSPGKGSIRPFLETQQEVNKRDKPVKKTDISFLENQKNSNEERSTIEDVADIDIRQAVLYSEILKRPQY